MGGLNHINKLPIIFIIITLLIFSRSPVKVFRDI